MKTDYNTISMILSAHGLQGRGAFHPIADDRVPSIGNGLSTKTLLLVGNVGNTMWPYFEAGRIEEENPLDQWTERVLKKIRCDLESVYGRIGLLFPSDGPPYYSFQRWALRAETVFPSPIGLLIHPEYGLWHAYRGALIFETELSIPKKENCKNPCDTCENKPCLLTCPVKAFAIEQYDVNACRDYIKTSNGDFCLASACQARRACPIGTQNCYDEAQSRFHMAQLNTINKNK